MQVLLDDVPRDVDAATVSQAIQAAAALAGEQGRLIVDVTVDGAPWTTEELPEGTTANPVVVLRSADPAGLIRTTFTQADQALADAGALQRDAAEMLQSDRAAAAMDKLADAMAIWEAVRQAVVNGAALAGLDLEAPSAGLEEAAQLLQGKLEGLQAALRAGDHVTVSDTLLYEFPEVVTRWRTLLRELQQQVG